MSDNIAAATLAAAVLGKLDLPEDADVVKETIRLYRRFRAVVQRVDAERKGGADAAGDEE